MVKGDEDHSDGLLPCSDKLSNTDCAEWPQKGFLTVELGSRFLGLAVLYTSQAFLCIPSLFPPTLTYENGADLLHDFHPFTTCYSFFDFFFLVLH